MKHDTEENKHLHSYETHSEDEEYIKKFDGFKPKFSGIPEGYFPNTWGNVSLIYLLLALLYCFSAGIFAFLLWLLFLDTVTVPWIFAGIGFVYVCIVLGSIFIGGTMRGDLEKKYMQSALEQQNAKAGAAL